MKKMNKKVAKVIECYDSARGGTRYWCAAELYDNGYVSCWAIGKLVFFKITKDGLDEIVKDAMDNGYDKVVIGDDIKKELGL